MNRELHTLLVKFQNDYYITKYISYYKYKKKHIRKFIFAQKMPWHFSMTVVNVLKSHFAADKVK